MGKLDKKKTTVIDYLAKCLAVVCWESSDKCPFGSCPLGHKNCKGATHIDWVEAASDVANLYCDHPEVFIELMRKAAELNGSKWNEKS